ncbi:spermidine synthase [Nocardioides salsibiostraticola]
MRIEELDYQDTPIGVISLRRRHDRTVGRDVYEVKIDDEFLMSSLFTVVERELSHLGLAQAQGENLRVLVGGLGLGYTAVAALEDPRVTELTVIDAVAAVIDWHERDLLPETVGLAADPRVRLVQGDFFALSAAAELPDAPYDAILLDVDHSPANLLHPSHGPFYTAAGLTTLATMLAPGGVFGLWSDDPPDRGFEAALAAVFATSASHVVTFPNPITGGESASTVYVAVTPAVAPA